MFRTKECLLGCQRQFAGSLTTAGVPSGILRCSANDLTSQLSNQVYLTPWYRLTPWDSQKHQILWLDVRMRMKTVKFRTQYPHLLFTFFDQKPSPSFHLIGPKTLIFFSPYWTKKPSPSPVRFHRANSLVTKLK